MIIRINWDEWLIDSKISTQRTKLRISQQINNNEKRVCLLFPPSWNSWFCLHIFSALIRNMGQGNVFTRVCHSVHRGSAFPQYHGQVTPSPRRHTPPPDIVNRRVVCILLECILVLLILAYTCFYGGHWYPCFGLLVTSPLRSKARVGSALFALGGGIRVRHSLRFISGATHFIFITLDMSNITGLSTKLHRIFCFYLWRGYNV